MIVVDQALIDPEVHTLLHTRQHARNVQIRVLVVESDRLVGTMNRISDPEKTPFAVEAKDRFKVTVKSKTGPSPSN